MDSNGLKPPSDNDSFYEDGTSPEEEEEEQRNQMDVDVPKDEEPGTGEAHQHAREHIQQIKQHAQTARRVGGAAKKTANATKSAAQATKIAGSVGKQAAGTAVRSLAALLFDTPVGWIILFLILVFLIVLLIISFQSSKNPEGTAQVHITKTAPAAVKNGENIDYTINVDYAGSAQAIVVTDPVPENADFVSASGSGMQLLDAKGQPTTDPKAARTIKWTLIPGGGSVASPSAKQ